MEKLKFNQFKHGFGVLLLCLLFLNMSSSLRLNDEGLALLRVRDKVVSDPFGALENWNNNGDADPCSWFGVECSEGKVIVLNLRDCCLGGTLAPELSNLIHIKSIILRNNSFTGTIPEGIRKLEEIEVLDLGYNNFSGQLPPDFGSNLSLTILLLDNNRFDGSLSPEIYELKMLSEFQVDENQLSSAAKGLSCNKRSISLNVAKPEDAFHRRLLQAPVTSPPKENNQKTKPETPLLNPPILKSPPPSPPSPSQSLSPPLAMPNMTTPAPTIPTSPPSSPAPNPTSPPSSPAPGAFPAEGPKSSFRSSPTKHHRATVITGAIGGVVFLLASIMGIYLCRKSKVSTVKPWATGLSGKIQKVFVTGVPNLKRNELETACEDFSNVIGSSPIGSVYKGTLSNGVEIAVTSVMVTSAKDWSNNLEVQFRTKIDTLSKVNHKNFVNLLGYCEENEPFTRMMVFEYSPNGTLFEHLHIKEAEHLDWGMRLRIAMGMAYCLDHMHNLNPPIIHNNLNSSAVNLTEDYAAKISEFTFWNEAAAAEMKAAHVKLSDTSSAGAGPESNVYSFGVILFEMITSRLPYLADNCLLEDWASDYLRGGQSLKEKVDPSLKSFDEEQLEELHGVIKSCVHPDPKKRPTMREVAARLREITGITMDGAIPKLSPLWWAELEILSDAS